MASISLRNVTKVYDGAKSPVVPNLNLEIPDKEFVILVGPSGCGKSTTLRMIAGLESITSGDLYIDDKRVNDIPPKDRDIAMVFQNYALYPHMSVYKNIAFGLTLRKVDKDEIDKRVHEAAKVDFFELLGADVNLYVYINGTKAIVRMPSSRKRPASDEIKVAVDLQFAHFFDKETEQAICH